MNRTERFRVECLSPQPHELVGAFFIQPSRQCELIARLGARIKQRSDGSQLLAVVVIKIVALHVDMLLMHGSAGPDYPTYSLAYSPFLHFKRGFQVPSACEHYSNEPSLAETQERCMLGTSLPKSSTE